MVVAALGAVMAFTVVLALYVLSANPDVGGITGLRFLLSQRDGFVPPGSLAAAIVWSIPALAGAIAGWVFAERSLRRERWAGSWMGVLTYFVAIVLAPFMALLATLASPSDGFGYADMGLNFVALQLSLFLVGAAFAVVLLAPLLVVCIAAGATWASIVRGLIARAAPAGPTARGSLSGVGLVVLVVVLGGLWLAVVAGSPFRALEPGGFD